ncbi:MAG TPA: energy-coupling factor ABC transporter permease, partial [Armatimonadota bacterium]
MHITEGIITGVPAVASAGIAVAFMAIGARKMRTFVKEHPEQKPLLGMAGAFIFFLSLIPLPALTGTCSHPCGSPLAGILLGPWIGVALSGLSLLLQAAFFAHGGFSTWGVNLLALGIGGAVCGWLAFVIGKRLGLPLWLAGALGGLVGDVMTYVISGLVLAGALVTGPHPKFSYFGYLTVIYLSYLPVQGPI